MKKIIILIGLLIIVALSIPFPSQMRDGGTVHYNAVLYDIYDMHRINPIDPSTSETEVVEGIIIEVLGVEIFNNTKLAHE